ncbi:MAG TPA: phage tail protein [Pyrinomonadaceae bacterium]
MRLQPQSATYWLIGGGGGWLKRTAASEQTAVSDAGGVRLASAPGGPLSLVSPDGSLGGLTLPLGMAFDAEHTLYLLSPDYSIKRFDPDSRRFLLLPNVGGSGRRARRFRKARSLAIAGRWLYVADAGNRRVQVFDLKNLLLTEVLTGVAAGGRWKPVDVAAHGHNVYILDRHNGRVYVHTPGGHLCLRLERADRAGQWSRVVVDRAGRVYLLNTSDPTKPSLEPADQKEPPHVDPGALLERFEPPPVRLDERGRFCLPASLARPCDRRRPEPAPAPEVQLALCAPFDRAAKRCGKPAPPRHTRTAEGAFLTYVLEVEQRRVRAYTDGGRKLRHSFGDGLDWEPADVAARGLFAFVLDGRDGTVYRHRAGRDELRAVVAPIVRRPSFTRIRIDEDGIVYLHAPGQAKAHAYDCRGHARGEKNYREVAALFEAEAPPEPAALTSGLIFDRRGEPVGSVDASDASGVALYTSSGEWRGKPLDSSIHRCQWHRIELSASALPPGSHVEVFTYAHDEEDDVQDARDDDWQTAYEVVAPLEPPPCGSAARTYDFLVQSGAGRYLSVRMKLRGDSFSTPVVQSLKVHYPRESYLKYLPAVWSSDDESRIFLEHFLSIFQTEWDGMDRELAEVEKHFDPDAVPAGPFLEHLARQWLALPLEGDWTAEQKRRLLAAAPQLYPHRGQLAGLRGLVAVYLANLAGMETSDVSRLGFPVIVEGFREREHLFLAAAETARLNQGGALWSASVKRRLQLGVYAQEGEVELVSTGDPERDVFHEYAHSFRVFVPAGWVRTAADERMLRRAIEAEKPAQTRYELCLVEPAFRVGVQSTVEVDTILGETPATALGRGHDPGAAPSRRARGRLGLDTVLAPSAADVAMRLAPGATVGRKSPLS